MAKMHIPITEGAKRLNISNEKNKNKASLTSMVSTTMASAPAT